MACASTSHGGDARALQQRIALDLADHGQGLIAAKGREPEADILGALSFHDARSAAIGSDFGGGMAILGYTRDALGNKINKVLSSSHPIDTPEKLKGRDGLLEEIARLLYMDGRSVFIYGDRGVGKSPSVPRQHSSIRPRKSP
ncbi:hypothetical protein [Achromobacter spanius]|uniref:hypothetical protein n=1 Tax=Achromobacter spanius TaxID=217203 RepID=UPI003812E0E6